MKLIKFAYCNEFKCLAEKCPETCCQQWNVFFSQAEYLNLVGTMDSSNCNCGEKLKNIIQSSFIKVYSDSAEKSPNYAVIKFNEKDICPLLDDNGLCLLQKELGEDCLGYACATFPRLKTAIGNDTYIYSCNMSCPKTAELLIAHEEGLVLTAEKYDNKDRFLNAGLYSAPAVSQQWEGFPYYWDIKNAQIEILQNRNLTISERMLALGYFSQKTNKYINHKTGANIISLIKRMDSEMCGKIAKSLRPSQTDKSFAIKSVGIFAKLFLSAQEKGSKHLKELFQTVADSIGLVFQNAANQKIDTTFNFERYNKNLKLYNGIEQERPYIIENILVNLIFTQPLSDGVWKNYFIAAVFYNMIKTCIPAFLNEGWNDSDLASAISRAAKMTVNNELIKKDTLLDFVDNRSYTLPHSAFLVGEGEL